MTTVSQLITDAYQYNNLVALSVIPNAAEQAKALRYLNRIFRSVFGNELGESLSSWRYDSVYGLRPTALQANDLRYYSNNRPPANTRVVANLTAAATITLPSVPQDGARFALQDATRNFATYPMTVSANGRLIENATQVVLNTNGSNAEWFFREDTGNWAKIADLALTDDFPLPSEFEEFFIMMLAMRLGASEDIDLNNQLVFVLKDVTKKLKSRYRQRTQISPELGTLNLPSSPYSGYNTIRFTNG